MRRPAALDTLETFYEVGRAEAISSGRQVKSQHRDL